MISRSSSDPISPLTLTPTMPAPSIFCVPLSNVGPPPATNHGHHSLKQHTEFHVHNTIFVMDANRDYWHYFSISTHHFIYHLFNLKPQSECKIIIILMIILIIVNIVSATGFFEDLVTLHRITQHQTF